MEVRPHMYVTLAPAANAAFGAGRAVLGIGGYGVARAQFP
jgi:hypothetical protein